MLLLFNISGKAEVYRLGDTTAGTGIEYRTQNGFGVSVGTRKIYQIHELENNFQEKIDYKFGIGIRKLFNNDKKVKPYIGGAYIHRLGFGLKGELGLQIKAGEHISVNPVYTFQFYRNKLLQSPGLGIAVEF